MTDASGFNTVEEAVAAVAAGEMVVVVDDDDRENEQNVFSTGYPKERIHFIKGKVEETLPKHAPGKIALLRLDTDWYESTAHEMTHLYPRLSENGVLIIDDYGHWQGARQAVDEYFARQEFRPLLTRMDYSARMLVKPVGGKMSETSPR